MKTRLFRNALGIALGLCAAVVPGYSGTVNVFLSFSNGVTSGAANSIETTGTPGATETLSAFSAPYTQLMINNAPDAADNGTWTIATNLVESAGNVFTMTGSFTSCSNCGAGANLTSLGTIALETFNATLPYSATCNNAGTSGCFDTASGQTSVNVAYGAVTNLAEYGTFLTDLGLYSVSSTMTGGGVGGTGPGTIVSGSGSSAIYGFKATSDTMSITLNGSTPEPVTFLLLGTGLLATAWFARRRRAVQS